MNKFQKELLKLFFGDNFVLKEDLEKSVAESTKKMSPTEYAEKEGMTKQIYDFLRTYNGRISSYGITSSPIIHDQSRDREIVTQNLSEQELAITPKSVYNELERVPCPVELNADALELRKALIERKLRLGIDNSFTKDEMRGMLECLERRSKYEENREFFEQWNYTLQGKIDALLEKHESLCMKETRLFIPTFPDAAIDVMERYTEKVKELFDKTPTFYVIAKKEDFAKKDKKHDPILLVQSPFGFYWQILGAWDEEMLLLEEL